MPRCVAIGCKENGNHSFPKDPRMRKLWERATKIKNFKASNNSRLCARHFQESDYQGISSSTGLPQVNKYLKKTAIPSIFSWSRTVSSSSVAREQRYLNRSACQELFPSTSQDQLNIAQEIIDLVPIAELEIEIKSSENKPIPIFCKSENSRTTQTPHLFRFLSSEDMLSDPKSVLFYTGLENIDKFKLVFATLLPMANHLHYRSSQVINVSIEDQLLLMLIKLRRNKEDFELSKFFGISTTEVGNIFVTWVNFVYEMWSKVNIWPSRQLVAYYMPKLFKQHHPSTRLIVDGTEVPISKPKNPLSQQATFSSYKHKNTIKFLVGATPGGLLCFCSEGYAGSTSDRQITERSSLVNRCDENDSIMADRGFNVQDLFEHKNIAIHTPTFLKGLTQLPGIKLKHDRKLASNRIHIERLIGLTKTYKILKNDVNAYYVPLLSRIFFICMMLCNFKEGIVK